MSNSPIYDTHTGHRAFHLDAARQPQCVRVQVVTPCLCMLYCFSCSQIANAMSAVRCQRCIQSVKSGGSDHVVMANSVSE